MSGPVLLEGGRHCDDRGAVRYVNGFNVTSADRFYLISPAHAGEWRGWVGHRRDRKWFFAAAGDLVICVVSLEELEHSRSVRPYRFRLSERESQLLEVPPGFATAIQARVAASSLLVFSTGRIESAAEDMFRYPLGDVSQWAVATEVES